MVGVGALLGPFALRRKKVEKQSLLPSSPHPGQSFGGFLKFPRDVPNSRVTKGQSIAPDKGLMTQLSTHAHSDTRSVPPPLPDGPSIACLRPEMFFC